MRVALDTNIIVYAEGVNGPERQAAAVRLLSNRLLIEAAMIPVQVLGELFAVLARKIGQSQGEALGKVVGWAQTIAVVPTQREAMLMAARLATDHHLNIWDSTMLAVAAEAECRLLLSEDMQEGFTWNGVTVTNPFAADHSLLLDDLLSERP